MAFQFRYLSEVARSRVDEQPPYTDHGSGHYKHGPNQGRLRQVPAVGKTLLSAAQNILKEERNGWY